MPNWIFLLLGIILVIGWLYDMRANSRTHRKMLDKCESEKDVMWVSYIRNETNKGINLFFGFMGIILIIDFFI